MPRLILTYHATRLEQWNRSGADLLGLAADLALLAEIGMPVLPLADLLDPACAEGVAITFDDGTRMDGESIQHPTLGRLPSMLSVLVAARMRLPKLQASSFVIASAQARVDLDAGLVDAYGPDLMCDAWWRAAAHSGLMDLENHSWDHNHPLVQCSAQRDNRRGSFLDIETAAEAEAEISAASVEIERVVGRRPRYFAYPFGDMSDYLRRQWLPQRGPEIGLEAAFSTEPRALGLADDRWALPRFVSGRDWRDDASLSALLRSV
ncbi:polysaccharide deacetylase family protein [Aquimonas sp.]|uniref:polysaccharide deacetylase family protein n=1 Tax=Aquimonas sp. TaxID=1872588 RepID=UPI0037C00AE1